MRAVNIENKNTKTDKGGKSSFVNFAGAVGGIVSGIILMSSGLILWGISSVTLINFNRWEAGLIASSFVSLAVGAHFQDLIDKENKRKRRQKLKL